MSAAKTDTNIKVLLTDASFVAQDNEPTLDTTGTETVARNKTVRSRLDATRRLLRGASKSALHFNTLDGKMLLAIKNLVPSNPTAAQIINAVNDAVTGGSTTIEVNEKNLSSRSLLTVLSDVTVVRASSGGFAIDDFGAATGLFRAVQARSLHIALRRVMADAGSKLFHLKTLSGAMSTGIANLTASTATGTDIKTEINNVANETSTANDSALLNRAANFGIGATIPSLSTLNMLSVLLRKRSGSNRDVILDNAGFNTSAANVAGDRYSLERTLFDMASNAGTKMFTTSGQALTAVANLNPSTATIADIVNAFKNNL